MTSSQLSEPPIASLDLAPRQRYIMSVDQDPSVCHDERQLKKLTEEGYGKERIFKMMLAQYIEDLSDRETERYLQENVAAKYFCGFSLTDKTPDYTLGLLKPT